MSFNPDLNKQVHKVIFSKKITKLSHPIIYFNNAPVSCVYPEEKLNFSYHVKEKMSKAMKGMGVIKKISMCSLDILLLQYINCL